MSSLDWCGTTSLTTGMKCFTTYFGTKLHGAEVTWANNPTGTGTDKTELKIIYKQILTSRLYIWYSSKMTEDVRYFKGTWDMNTAGTVSQSGTGTVLAAANTVDNTKNDYTIAQDATKTPQGAAPSDLVFHMQFKNPVTTSLPAYDGFYALATTKVTFDITKDTPAEITGNSVRPAIDIDWDTSIQDLIPNGDYDFTTDVLYKNGSATPC
jgi:hypothetical protein